MQAPLIPPDEAQRFAALRSLDILDTQPEERFDRITRLAAALLDMPITLVSLVDADRQWFKSVCGLDVTQTPGDISICGHAILKNELFIVSDARADVRFYASRPLKTAQGERVGPALLKLPNPRPAMDRNGRNSPFSLT